MILLVISASSDQFVKSNSLLITPLEVRGLRPFVCSGGAGEGKSLPMISFGLILPS
jgi:hypothetical protein